MRVHLDVRHWFKRLIDGNCAETWSSTSEVKYTIYIYLE